MSPGCTSNAGAHRPVTRTVLDGEGVSRTFYVHGPRNADPHTPLAVAFLFHAGGGSAASAMRFGLENVEGAAETTLFVYPQGRPYGEDGVGWNDSCQGYDMAFFDNMIANVEAADCVDENRIFVAGFSWGCDFVTALACCRGDAIRGVAAAACSDDFKDPADPATYANLACPVPSRAAIRFTHEVEGDVAYPPPLFATTSRLFRHLNACPEDTSQPVDSTCVRYSGCRQDVIDCAIPGIGHTPGPEWAAETWTFFSGLR